MSSISELSKESVVIGRVSAKLEPTLNGSAFLHKRIVFGVTQVYKGSDKATKEPVLRESR